MNTGRLIFRIFISFLWNMFLAIIAMDICMKFIDIQSIQQYFGY